MNKRHRLIILLVLSWLCVVGCASKHESRWLIVSEAVHFGVQPGSGSLNLPVFAGTLDVDNIVHDVSQAEYYHRKFAAVYGEKSFYFIADSTIELLFDMAEALSRHPSVYGYDSESARIDLDHPHAAVRQQEQLDVTQALRQADRLHRSDRRAAQPLLRRHRVPRRIGEAGEMARALHLLRVHPLVDDAEHAHVAAADVAVDVDLLAVNGILEQQAIDRTGIPPLVAPRHGLRYSIDHHLRERVFRSRVAQRRDVHASRHCSSPLPDGRCACANHAKA